MHSPITAIFLLVIETGLVIRDGSDCLAKSIWRNHAPSLFADEGAVNSIKTQFYFFSRRLEEVKNGHEKSESRKAFAVIFFTTPLSWRREVKLIWLRYDALSRSDHQCPSCQCRSRR